MKKFTIAMLMIVCLMLTMVSSVFAMDYDAPFPKSVKNPSVYVK